MESYKQKYLKYKNKYLELKGGANMHHFKNKNLGLNGGAVPDAATIEALRASLLTAADIRTAILNNGRVYNTYHLYEPIAGNPLQENSVLRKLKAVPHPLKRADHIINCEDFNNIYFTSDIHSDYRKFIQILKSINMVRNLDDYEESYDVLNPANPRNNDIYDLRIIEDVDWNLGEGVLLVIVGDIVDGKRDIGQQVDDNRGNFEFLLLCFLYNLRIKARIQGSEILYTIGNHDFHTVIENHSPIRSLFLGIYVTNEANIFFNNHIYRKRALYPFFDLNPYYLLTFNVGGVPQMGCIHAGFHRQTDAFGEDAATRQLRFRIEALQMGINAGNRLDSITNLDFDLVRSGDGLELNDIGGGLWARTYGFQGPARGAADPVRRPGQPLNMGSCNRLTAADYPFIVVGHCPTTHTVDRPLDIMFYDQELPAAQRKYQGCSIFDGKYFTSHTNGQGIGQNWINEFASDLYDPVTDTKQIYDNTRPQDYVKTAANKYLENGIGCIVTDCEDANGAPRLAFVDTAMSNGFRYGVSRKDYLDASAAITAAAAGGPASTYAQRNKVAEDRIKLDNKLRTIKILKLTHVKRNPVLGAPPVVPGPNVNERYYNKIESVSAGLVQAGVALPAPVILYESPHAIAVEAANAADLAVPVIAP